MMWTLFAHIAGMDFELSRAMVMPMKIQVSVNVKSAGNILYDGPLSASRIAPSKR